MCDGESFLHTTRVKSVFKSPTPERGLLADTLCFATRHSVPAEPESLRQHRIAWALHVLSLPPSPPLAVSAGIFFFFFAAKENSDHKKKMG